MLEVMIGLALLAIVLGNIAMLQNASADAYESGIFGSALEDKAEETMDRIAIAIMSTSIDSLDEVLSAPSSVSDIDYEVVLEIVDGEPVLGTPEEITFRSEDGQIVWVQDPGSAQEMEISWSRYVSGMLEGEEPDGEDNNNGINDEEGLAFNRDVNQITIRLTLARSDSNHVEYTRTRSRRVTCRN